MKFTKYRLALIAIILNTIIWSAASPILKWSIGDAPPFALAFFRFFFATIILFPIVIKSIRIALDDVFKILVLALVGIAAHIIFFYLGLSLAPSINVPIITSSTPLFLIFGAIFFLHEKPKKKVLIGTLISFIGVLIIILRPLVDHGSFESILGNLYHVLGVITFVIYTLLLKKYNLKYPLTTLLFWMFLFSTLAIFPLYLVEMQTTPYFHIDTKGIIGIIYGAVFSSLLGFFFYNYAVKYIKANEIGIFVFTEPFITALIAIPLLGEQITVSYLLGALFVFAGIIIAEAKLHFHPGNNLKSRQEKHK